MEALKNQFLQIGLDALIAMMSWFFFGYSLGIKDNAVAMVMIILAASTSTLLLVIMMRDLFRSITVNDE